MARRRAVGSAPNREGVIEHLLFLTLVREATEANNISGDEGIEERGGNVALREYQSCVALSEWTTPDVH